MNNTVINSNKTLNFPHKKYMYSPCTCKQNFRLTGIEHVRCNSMYWYCIKLHLFSYMLTNNNIHVFLNICVKCSYYSSVLLCTLL